jgi:putative endonuclease
MHGESDAKRHPRPACRQAGLYLGSRKMNQYYVYILASKRNGTLYVGVTNDLIKRVWEHKSKLVEGFTKKYRVNKLVYYEECSDIKKAILREKKIKAWKRAWKLELIEKLNPNWNDIYSDLV